MELDRDKPLVEQALDVFVYAPVGVASAAMKDFPDFVDRGRSVIARHVRSARSVGKFVVNRGERQLTKLLGEAAEMAFSNGSPGSATAAGAGEGQPNSAGQAGARAATSGNGSAGATDGSSGQLTDSELAIPNYDALSASQVVQRLDGLSHEELAAVGQYEAATRRRKTILTRVAQLQPPPQ